MAASFERDIAPLVLVKKGSFRVQKKDPSPAWSADDSFLHGSHFLESDSGFQNAFREQDAIDAIKLHELEVAFHTMRGRSRTQKQDIDGFINKSRARSRSPGSKSGFTISTKKSILTGSGEDIQQEVAEMDLRRTVRRHSTGFASRPSFRKSLLTDEVHAHTRNAKALEASLVEEAKERRK
jgi:hypothetical protein